MTWPLISTLLVAPIAACCLFVAGSAHAQVAPADALLTVDQAKGAFTTAGYDVGQAVNWNWTSPPVTTFQVRDGHRSTDDRTLMVLVYADSSAARSAQLQAQTRDETAEHRGLVYSDEHGPQLVPGYGESVWRQNVALVQSSQSELNRLFTAAVDCDGGMGVQSGMQGQPTMQALTITAIQAVDHDFVALLSNGTAIDL
jgi:hypothetical protein